MPVMMMPVMMMPVMMMPVMPRPFLSAAWPQDGAGALCYMR